MALVTSASAHAFFAECGSRGFSFSMEPGDPIPRGMGRGVIDESTRRLTVRDTTVAADVLLPPGAPVGPGATISIEVPLLPNEQVLCEVTDGATFPNGCNRQANELIFAARAPTEPGTVFSVWCVHSSGPGRGMFATERQTFHVVGGNVRAGETLPAVILAAEDDAAGAEAESAAAQPTALPRDRARTAGVSNDAASAARAGTAAAVAAVVALMSL
jgi:hypothetical protein